MKNPFIPLRKNGIPIIGICLYCLFLASCIQQPNDIARSYDWFEFVIPDLDTGQSAVDMSFLNPEPAGKTGFVKVKNGHFADGSGKHIRFFGTNLTFNNSFPDKAIASKIAVRLKKLGYNVIRFHHMDMRPAPSGIWEENMTDFNSEQLDKLDWLIFELKRNGIYTNLNMHVSRNYPDAEYEHHHFNFGKSLDQFYRPYIEMQKAYARDLLSHKNPYTGTTYLNEPAIAFVEVNNENSLLSNWWLLPELKGAHRKAMNRMWIAWLSEQTGYQDEIAKKPDVFKIASSYNDDASNIQKEMFWAFLMTTEMAYAREMTEYIRDELNSSSLISETQASYSGCAGVLREANFADFVDMHAYHEHPSFPNARWSGSDWLIKNSSMVTSKTGGTLLNFGQHRIQNMPLTISEYDHPAPNDFCAEMYPMLNSVAAFQDWDGIYHFTFDGPYESGHIHQFFSSTGHPLKQIFLPVGAVLFRMGAVNTGKNRIQLQLPENSVLNELVDSGNRLRLHRSNMDVIWDKAGGSEALIIQRPMEVIVGGKDLVLSETSENPNGPWVSETGELSWNNNDSLQAVFTVNAPAAKVAVGYIGGKSIELGEVIITMDTTPYNWGCISLVTLDGASVSDSKKMLLVAAGRAESTNMGWNDDRTTVGRIWGDKPTLVEGLPGIIDIKGKNDFKVSALDPSGNPIQEIELIKTKGGRAFGIGAQNKTLWYLILRD